MYTAVAKYNHLANYSSYRAGFILKSIFLKGFYGNHVNNNYDIIEGSNWLRILCPQLATMQSDHSIPYSVDYLPFPCSI